RDGRPADRVDAVRRLRRGVPGADPDPATARAAAHRGEPQARRTRRTSAARPGRELHPRGRPRVALLVGCVRTSACVPRVPLDRAAAAGADAGEADGLDAAPHAARTGPAQPVGPAARTRPARVAVSIFKPYRQKPMEETSMQAWHQIYTPLGSLGLSAFVA